MQIEHVHLLVNMQKCTCKICNFSKLVILHICKHEFAILVIIIIWNWEAFNFIILKFINGHMQFMNLQFYNL
jgi:hypothetical protein